MEREGPGRASYAGPRKPRKLRYFLGACFQGLGFRVH